MCCGRDLSDEFSMLTKMGKTCSSHMKVEYIKDKSEVERFRNDYLKRVEEIGEMEFWIQNNDPRPLIDVVSVYSDGELHAKYMFEHGVPYNPQ